MIFVRSMNWIIQMTLKRRFEILELSQRTAHSRFSLFSSLYREDVVVGIEMRPCVNCACIQGFVNSVMVFYLWIRGHETEQKKSLAWWHYYQCYRAVLWVLCRGGAGTKDEEFSFISNPLGTFLGVGSLFCTFRKKKKLRAAPSAA